jgi:hypothetical protein
MLDLLREKQASLRLRFEDIEMMQSDLLEAEERISSALADDLGNQAPNSNNQN